MALDWQTFKSSLGLSSGTSVFYIDDEGSKIPIDSDCEFQEALRLAQLNKNSLKLIFHGDKLKPNETSYVHRPLSMQSAAVNPAEKCIKVKVKNGSAMAQNCSSKENTCNCHGDVAPDWFTHYMKKFKKEVIHELKSYIHDTVHSAVDKKLSCTKSDTGELFCERNENPFSSASAHAKKKKKSSERDLMDFVLDTRQLRLPKKLNATKPERLEMLDQKTKALLEEKRRLLESKDHSRSKLDKNCFATSSKSHLTKSASFAENETCLFLPRESDFTVIVTVHNDGSCQWRSPQLVCFEAQGVTLAEYKKPLPKLCPRGSCSVLMKGKLLPETSSSPYFRCRVLDREIEIISPVFDCRFNVVPKKLAGDSVKEPEEVATALRDTVGTLIDFEKDLITCSQKKIEENISEIERRLHDIDLLQPSFGLDYGAGKETKGADAFQTGCDLMQLHTRLAQEGVKNDCAGLATSGGLCNSKSENEKGMNGKTDVFDKVKKDGDQESSDSDLSIIFMSEEEEDEEDNFFVVPPESLSTAESANEDKKSPKPETEGNLTTEQPITVTQEGEKLEETPTEPKREDVATKETFQRSPTRCRCSPFAEENSKPKKMKSKSTEYQFTPDNATEWTFQYGIFEGRPSRFTFTGEKDEKTKEVKAGVPAYTDALGRTIYAVNGSGWCLPVKDLFQEKDKPLPDHFEGPQESQNGQARRNDRLPENPPINTLPNALINGASNVASLAFNTAKSVITNLQSAFVTEGKTEMGQPAYEDRVKPSMEAMFRLYDMGYLNIERNRMLLLLHNNNLNKVIDELSRLNDTSERSF